MLGAEDSRRFSEDGVITLRGVLGPDWVEHLAAALSSLSPTPLAREFVDRSRGAAGSYRGDMYLSAASAAFREFALRSPIAEIAARLLDSTQIFLFNDELLIKAPGTDHETPWHHDLPYWPVEGDQVLSAWIPLDPVDASSGRVEYVRGSHRWQRRFHPRNFESGEARTTSEDEVDVEEHARGARDAIVAESLSPGDCQFFHGLTVHRAGGNFHRERSRRAIILRLVGDDARYQPRPRTIPLIWAPPLAPGERFRDCELFPRLWPRAGAG